MLTSECQCKWCSITYAQESVGQEMMSPVGGFPWLLSVL